MFLGLSLADQDLPPTHLMWGPPWVYRAHVFFFPSATMSPRKKKKLSKAHEKTTGFSYTRGAPTSFIGRFLAMLGVVSRVERPPPGNSVNYRRPGDIYDKTALIFFLPWRHSCVFFFQNPVNIEGGIRNLRRSRFRGGMIRGFPTSFAHNSEKA